MKVTYSILISDKENIYVNESEIKSDLNKYIDVLKPTSLLSTHWVLFEISNEKNERLHFKDDVQNLVVQLCFLSQEALLNNKTYIFSTFNAPVKIIFEPHENEVLVKYRDDYQPETNYEVTFNKNKLCVELQNCGQRYIDFYNRLPMFEDMGTEFYQELSDKTKTLLRDHNLILE